MHAELIETIEGRGTYATGLPRILVCAPSYLPGFKSGGPIRCVANMVANLNSHFDFYVVTRDRDATDTEAYSGITPDRWHCVAGARVLYCSSVRQPILRRAFKEVQPDIILLNSFHDSFTRIMVILRRVGAFGDTPVVLAPRGEFSRAALEIKRTKKLLYRYAAKQLGLHEHLLWQASAPHEKRQILEAAPARRMAPDSIHVALEISDAVASTTPHLTKQPGIIKLAFIARISEMKNLHYLLDVLREIRGSVLLALFGPVASKDKDYWDMCKEQLTRLPANIQVEYRGSVDHSAVRQLLHDHHFFVLPTKGENFCHAAVESFITGTPVLLSDQTPWINLSEARAGFDIPLADRNGWIAALQNCVNMDQNAYSVYLTGARKYGQRFSVQEAEKQQLAVFEAALHPNL